MSIWPIKLADVKAARERIKPYVRPTPLRSYPALDAAVGSGIRVLVKHENHNLTNAFKVRNGLSALTMLTGEERTKGVIAGTRGNHGQGLAFAGQALGIPVTICVPHGNVKDKNEAMRDLGAELIEVGNDYDDTLVAVDKLVEERNLTLVHSTNNKYVLAGAGTITLEILEQDPEIDALVFAIGGGSQAVGAMTVVRELKPDVRVYGVQAEGASAIYESWRTGHAVTSSSATTFADGIATRSPAQMTFDALCEGLTGFVTVTDSEIADALRLLLRVTHNLVEGAGAAGLAGLFKLKDDLAGKCVGIVLSGGNIDQAMLKRVLDCEI
ncbi:MAG: threonine/serine dehydratase [Gemmatimonadales bacterium]